ncbi:MAG: hypothetical protein IJU23_10230, partial [Proteobacteria bacterium]|nr:hypothetical protein [Pseudomonadota bacterium]
LNISFDTVYNHIESFSPGECAGGLIGNMHEMANDSNIFKKAHINMEKLHTEIDTYTVSYPKGGINGGILSRIESNTVSATSASFFINYLLDSYATDVFGALFQDENTTSYSGFHSTHFGAAFSVKRTGGDLTDCEAQLPFCSESGLNLKTICDNLSNPENNFCKYYMRSGNGFSWDKSKFKLGDKEQKIPSMSKQVMDALTSAGVIPNTSK